MGEQADGNAIVTAASLALNQQLFAANRLSCVNNTVHRVWEAAIDDICGRKFINITAIKRHVRKSKQRRVKKIMKLKEKLQKKIVLMNELKGRSKEEDKEMDEILTRSTDVSEYLMELDEIATEICGVVESLTQNLELRR